jgi:hypothetical protein
MIRRRNDTDPGKGHPCLVAIFLLPLYAFAALVKAIGGKR